MWSLALVALPYFALELLITLNLPAPCRVFACFIVSGLVAISMALVRTGNGYLDYLLGSSLFTCGVDGIFLLLANPLHSFRSEKDTIPAYELPFLQRFVWVVCMCHCPRGVGWSFKVNHVPPASTRSRASFVTWWLLRAVVQYTIFEAALVYSRYNPPFTSSATIVAQPYVMRCISVIAFVARTYAGVNCLYFIAAAITVAAGLYEPRSWPDVFGRWRDAYTVRRFWGRTWHQLLRRFLGGIGNATTRAIGVSPRSRCSLLLQVLIAFFISGLVHVAGDVMLDMSRAGASFRFFLLQPIAIIAEESVISVASFVGIRKSLLTRLVGYAWVFIWLSICAPPWLDVLVDITMQAQDNTGASSAKKAAVLEMVVRWAGGDIELLMSSWFANA
ncbi:hypothetical protein BS17DRAFT_777171 [Gyrodon lividus]|nr:hypothetical protein BS17DRAFT_777171 [Gyrodon lividus]